MAIVVTVGSVILVTAPRPKDDIPTGAVDIVSDEMPVIPPHGEDSLDDPDS